MNPMNSRIREYEAVAMGRATGVGGQKVVSKRVDVGKGGPEIGKWTGFSHFETALTHLFPLDSTQVVDFPLLSRLRVFWLRVERGGGQWTVDNWQWTANRGNESNRTNGTNLARSTCKALRIVTQKSAKFHESPRKFAQIRPVNPRCYALLRVGPIFCGEGQETTFKEAMKPRKQTKIDHGCGTRMFHVARFGAREPEVSSQIPAAAFG